MILVIIKITKFIQNQEANQTKEKRHFKEISFDLKQVFDEKSTSSFNVLKMHKDY